MKYALIRLLLFVVSVLVILFGNYLYLTYPSIEIALWILAPIAAALVAWAFTSTIEAEVQDRVNEILDEVHEGSTGEKDEQAPE